MSEFPPGPGGIGQHAFSLAETLHELHYKVEILTQGDYASAHEIETFDRTKPYAITRFQRKSWFMYLSRLLTTYKVVSAFKPDRIIFSGKFPVWMLLWVRWFYSQSYNEVFLHGSEVKLPVWWQRALFYRSLQRADMLYPVSDYTKSLIPKQCIRQNCQVVPNGILIHELVAWDNVTPAKLTGYPSLLTVGRISPRKGQHRVIKALPQLAKTFPDVHYHIVGLSENQETVFSLAKQLGVSDRVTIHGHIKERRDLAAFYKSCHCFMMLSENQVNGDVEGFGIAILEANYFGKPAIGSNENGIKDAIDQGKTGFVVNADSPSDITTSLSEIMQSENYFKVNAIHWAAAHDWNEVVKAIL